MQGSDDRSTSFRNAFTRLFLDRIGELKNRLRPAKPTWPDRGKSKRSPASVSASSAEGRAVEPPGGRGRARPGAHRHHPRQAVSTGV